MACCPLVAATILVYKKQKMQGVKALLGLTHHHGLDFQQHSQKRFWNDTFSHHDKYKPLSDSQLRRTLRPLYFLCVFDDYSTVHCFSLGFKNIDTMPIYRQPFSIDNSFFNSTQDKSFSPTNSPRGECWLRFVW
jgi:hypothetical protein